MKTNVKTYEIKMRVIAIEVEVPEEQYLGLSQWLVSQRNVTTIEQFAELALLTAIRNRTSATNKRNV